MEITPLPALILDTSHLIVPALICRARERTSWHFAEFFTVNIRTRTLGLHTVEYRRIDIASSGASCPGSKPHLRAR